MTTMARPVTAVERAIDLMDAFSVSEPRLSVSDLARKTAMPKSTALRLARTLETRGFLVQIEGALWRLGPSAAWLGARYQVAFDLQGSVLPALKQLSISTRKTASFFVREGDARIRLMRVEGGGKTLRTHVGERLPLDRGSAGKVILAFAGAPGLPYDDIRRDGFHVTVGEAVSNLASIAAPVFGAGWSVVGALSVSGMRDEVSVVDLMSHAQTLVAVARNLSTAMLRVMDGNAIPNLPASHWHP